jgi:hypothetical protein
MKKFKVLSFLLSGAVAIIVGETAAAPASGLISNLLETVKKNSEQLLIAEQNLKADSYDLLVQKSIFNTRGYLKSSYSNQQTPPTSPFAPASSTVKEYEAGIEKLWSQGLQTDLTYVVRDSETVFPSRPDFTFVSPTLQLQVSTSLVQDLVYKRYSHALESIERQQASLDLDSKREKKTTLVQALLDFSVLLDQKAELGLQIEVCKNTKRQSRNLSQKRKRGSVSKRDYLLGLKDLSNCEASIERLNRSMIEKLNAFASNYNTDFKDFSSPDVDSLFSEAEKIYEKMRGKQEGVNLENQDDIKSLNLRLSSLESKQAELDAKTKVNVALELRSGLSGLDNSLSGGQEDITGTEYPFVYVGLRLDLPLKNRQAVQEASANFYRLKAMEGQANLVKKQKGTRLETLQRTLEKDFLIYQKYKKSVGYSKSIMKEATRDFNNGRLDFNSLSDFNKALLVDQKTLSSHRIQLIVRVVEYLDFYQFFDTYL